MMMFYILAVLLVLAQSANAFDWAMNNLTLWHSESAYCDPASYLTRTYKGVLSGFVPTYHISDLSHDTEGYIGYHTGQAAIYVVFRGSETIQNWISDLDIVSTTYPMCSGCEVHLGFYNAEQGSINNILSQVKSLKAKFPTYSVVVTGHSLGAALATLTAVDLKNNGISPIRMFNYGSPRVFNTAGANWYATYITDRNRVTHHKDMVPHCPTSARFTHISGEYYEPDNILPVNLKTCTGNEDPTCSYQWTITSVDDHLWYEGVTMGGGGCASIL